MKRLTYFALSITVLLLLFLFPPITIFPSHAQTGGGIASPSDAEPETEEDTGIETESEIKDKFDENSQPETGTGPDIPDEFEEKLLPNYTIATLSNAQIAALADTDPIEITEIEIGKYTINHILLLTQGDSSASLDLPQLDKTIHFYREGAAFAEKDVCYSVSYETEDFDDTYRDQTGLFFLKASILLEDERYVMAPEVSTDILIPVFLYNPEQPSFLPPLDPDLNTYDGMETFHIVADVHTDLQQIKTKLIKDFPYQRFHIFFEDGYYLILPNAWDLSSVETGIPGIYPAYRRPELPQGILMEETPKAVCSINIQDSNVFTLSSPISFGNNIVIRWLYPTPEPSLFRLYYRIGEGDWIVDTSEYFMRLHRDGDGSLSLFLNPWEMEKDIHYQFQLEYDGVYSDILNLCVNQDGFYIPNEGDEDGGDRDNQTPPDVIQPPPDTSESEGAWEEGSSGSGHSQSSSSQSPSSSTTTVDAFHDAETEPDNGSADDSAAAVSGQAPAGGIPPSPKPAVAAEADTSTAATWSGLRIQQYLKASPGLPLIFEKDLIRVAIPADSPALSALSGSDFLHVEIQALSADTLRLTASLNEMPLTGIPLSVTMPWTGNDRPENLQIKEENGEWIGTVDELSAEGSITFTVTRSGVYTILPSAAKESVTAEERLTVAQPAIEPEVPSTPADRNILSVAALPTLLILGSSSIIVFLHYKRKKG